MHPDESQTLEFRILYRQGPGDTYVVVERRIPVARDWTWTTPQHHDEALNSIAANLCNGQYLVQSLITHDIREYRVVVKPVITER